MRSIIAGLTALCLVFAACAALAGPAPERLVVYDNIPAPEAAQGPDAKTLYAARCAGCHGADGAKGLKGKSAEHVQNALNGYKAKTFGGAKKELMEARAAALSDAEIKALATFVAGL